MRQKLLSADDLEASYGLQNRQYPKKPKKRTGFCGYETTLPQKGSMYRGDQSFMYLRSREAERLAAERLSEATAGHSFWGQLKLLGGPFNSFSSFDFTGLCCAPADGSHEIVVPERNMK